MKSRQNKVSPEIKSYAVRMFTPLSVVVVKEPRFIKLADNTPNPHGLIAPPNSPVMPKGNKP